MEYSREVVFLNLDNKAWEILFAQYYPMAYRSAVVIVRDKQMALDVVQESFLKAFCKIDQLQDIEKFKAWLGTIVTNTALDMLRKSGKSVSWEEMDWQSEEKHFWNDGKIEASPELLLEKVELRQELLELIDSLNYRQKQMILLKYYWEMTELEIAELLQCKHGTVKSTLFRARNKLAKMLNDEDDQGGVACYAKTP